MKEQKMIPRSEFLKKFSVLAVVGTTAMAVPVFAGVSRWNLIPSKIKESISEGYRIMLDKVTNAEFAKQLGTKFKIKTEDGRSHRVKLIEAEESRFNKMYGHSDQRAPFSLIFRGDAETILPQNNYVFEHAKLGTFKIFIVPVGPDEKGMQYQAIFN